MQIDSRLDALRALLAEPDDPDLTTAQGIGRGVRVIHAEPGPQVRLSMIYRVLSRRRREEQAS